MAIIQDGQGTSIFARVYNDGNDNRLMVQSSSIAREAIAAINFDSHIFHGQAHLSAGTNGGLFYIKYTGTKKFAITRCYFDAGSLTTPIKLLQIINPTPSNGTNISETGIVQKNFLRGTTLNAELYMSDASSDMTYTGGSEFHAFALQSFESKQRNMNGTNIMSQNNIWAFGWTTEGVGGGNATDGETISFSINGFEFETE